ncbi:MAG: hypothetical protein M3N98_02530 [Actinomycetota bacterium]|nr:hypothetical protein [Actinomycetota bacterium]
MIVVRSNEVNEDDAAWQSALKTWRHTARRMTGNRIEVIEYNEQEVGRLLQSGAINAADVVTGVRMGWRTAGRDHE